MAALHEALRSLGPVSFDEVSTSPDALQTYLTTHLAHSQLITESVPRPPPPLSSFSSSASNPSSSRGDLSSRRSISCAADLGVSSAYSQPLNPAHATLQKEWGKPLNVSPKDNPLGVSVYKLAAKDGRGAWFARRSVHAGLPFERWHTALLREFPASLAVQGGPGEGNVRGIGGEARLASIDVPGLGTVQVYRLSAQFPGPTTPRDFVTLLLTSENALRPPAVSAKGEGPYAAKAPRHLMVISKPCQHPDAEPQPGFIRGAYESVELVREVPLPARSGSRHGKKPSASAGDLSPRRGTPQPDFSTRTLPETPLSPPQSPGGTRPRGSTVSFAESRGSGAKGEAVDVPAPLVYDDVADPVEWVMVTRSDPGGSVPRFMVERGTPAGICADARKFLDWACSRDFACTEFGSLPASPPSLAPLNLQQGGEGMQRHGSIALQRNASLAGLPGQGRPIQRPARRYSDSSEEPEPPNTAGLISSMAQAAYAGLESYAAQAVGRGFGRSSSDPAALPRASTLSSSSSSSSPSISSGASFASAEDYLPDTPSSTAASGPPPQDRELAKLAARKAQLAAKLQRTRDKEQTDAANATEREAERARKAQAKAEARHAKELAKAEQRLAKEQERHARDLEALEAKKRKEERKELEKREREARRERERTEKSERDRLRAQVAALTAETHLLERTCRQLQAENTRLVAAVGKLPGGEDVLAAVRTSSDGKAPSLKSEKQGKTPSLKSEKS